ncbi:glycosyltransferase [Ideonella sp. A 288]|uniref:glycosyltransferase n=1 Tax=Ideonella sp. A 288 TaxID=1962181 RepID=UPI000B4A5A3E|nr:glycosyltransferase [Ideonella sp. A 288]
MNDMTRPPGHALRIAIVHEWLATWAGSEKVVEQWLGLYPQADLFTVVDFLPEADRHRLQGRVPRTSFVQRLPGARRHFRHYLPLMPLAMEQLDLSGYDLVLSSNHAVAKGVVTGPSQLHLSYMHSPMRYAWDLQHQYLRESGLERGLRSALARGLLHYLRGWDVRSANGVDAFAANSRFIAQRVHKAYRRSATVIHPPVATDRFTVGSGRDRYFLAASRMVPYKRMPLIVQAFADMPQHRLVVVGDGPDLPRVRALAAGHANIEVRGHVDDAALVQAMQQARAFVFAAEEDFGIAPVEAMACGTPVIAFGRGGSLDTVVDGVTGLFFHEQTAAALADAVARFDAASGAINPADCRRQAERFSEVAFRDRFSQWVEHQRALRAAPVAPSDEAAPVLELLRRARA